MNIIHGDDSLLIRILFFSLSRNCSSSWNPKDDRSHTNPSCQSNVFSPRCFRCSIIWTLSSICFLQKSCMHSSLLLCVSHSLPITSSLFPSPSWYLETRTTPENVHCAVFPFCYCFLSSILNSSLFLSTLRTVLFH